MKLYLEGRTLACFLATSFEDLHKLDLQTAQHFCQWYGALILFMASFKKRNCLFKLDIKNCCRKRPQKDTNQREYTILGPAAFVPEFVCVRYI